MSDSDDFPTPTIPQRGPLRDFHEFVRDERQQRLDGDPTFDAALFDQARDLILHRLAMVTEGSER